MQSTASVNTTRELFKLIWPYRGRLAVGLAAMVVSTVCMLSIPRYMKAVFDQALQNGDISALQDTLLMAFGVICLLAAAAAVRTFFIGYAANALINDFRAQVFRHLLQFDMGFFESRSSGEVVSRVAGDIAVIRTFLRVALAQFLRGAMLTVGAIVLLFYTQPTLTLLLFVVAPLLGGLTIFLGRYFRRSQKKVGDIFASAMDVVESAIYGMKTVKIFGCEEKEYQKHKTLLDESLRLAFYMAQAKALFLAVAVFSGFVTALLVIYYSTTLVMAGDMTLGTFMAFVVTLAFLADGLGNLAQFWPAYQEALGSTERVFELLAEQPQVTEAAHPTPLPLAKGGRAVACQQVTFHYPSRQANDAALHDINLHAKAGETVALVGPSGAGKSTLFGLLLRFYDVQQGQVLIDGIDVRQLAFADLRRAVSLVAQEPTIFSTSVFENIAYGAPDATEAEVIAAAKAAHAWDFIQELPEGLETQVGEKGVRLSGGQKQRVAIARTILGNPDVLLLDEATSHLDAESEQHVQQALADLQKDRTTLIIAHRLSTVKNADRIVVLDKGQKIAEGKHSALLQSCPLYKKLAQLQFLD